MFKPMKNPKPRDVKVRPNTDQLVLLRDGKIDWSYYDRVLVSFSGGKDSIACFLYMLELGCPPEKIQLWHQLIDGRLEGTERNFFDWSITEDYCQAIADAFGAHLKVDRLLYFQWKIGGFKGEMLRDNRTTAGVCFDKQFGTSYKTLKPGKTARPGTRLKFPQKAADLQTRWCTSYLKIDVMARAINNETMFDDANLLMLTGERREESGNRARYAEIDRHKSTSKKRHVVQWRPVIDWNEWSVWKIMERWKVNPHPCYHLGFGRCSCMTCVFSMPDQWASVLELDPRLMKEIADYEHKFGITIDRKKRDVIEVAEMAEPFPEVFTDTHQRKLAMSLEYPRREIVVEDWELPAGAGRVTGGPS